MTVPFFTEASQRYAASNAQTLAWMLDRPRLRGSFLNTKLNPLTLADYSAADGWRGPDHIYGWIQGRGLEALATHARAFARQDSALASRLHNAAADLYGALDGLRAEDGHAYFCYDAQMQPIRFVDGTALPQKRPADIFTYSDIFVAKGLVAAAAAHAPDQLARHVAQLETVIAAIEDGRFQMDEKLPLGAASLASEPADFGPRMIMLSAGGLLARVGMRERTGFADRFISHIIDHHFDPATGLLRNVPGQDACNVGHGIEFVGFALDHLGADADPGLLKTLQTILVSSFSRGFAGPGIHLVVSAETGAPVSPYCPWWSLPETIRSAALCYERSGDAEVLAVWQAADKAFFARYWRPEASIAYQCLTDAGPIDYVPATPDLDPGYHTGLSLLAAIEVVARLPNTFAAGAD
jgi:mannose/cellobiose epimerase-like protein (N-acyl-D-glucosamine 2-epimerase family)